MPEHPDAARASDGARGRRRPPTDPLVEERPLRLNRYLALSGVASRRASETLIADGRVTVNGTTANHPGARVRPGRDTVCVDGEPVAPVKKPCYVILHKPSGVLSTAEDDRQRRTVIDLLEPKHRARRLYPVGRLDFDSEGLVLLTDDGTLTHRLLHPRYHVAKLYRVWTDPVAGPAALAAFGRGVEIVAGERTLPAVARAAAGGFEIELREGKKRQIRRMCEAVGLRVERLLRVRFGPIQLGELAAGQSRELDPAEVEVLWDAAGLARHRLRG